MKYSESDQYLITYLVLGITYSNSSNESRVPEGPQEFNFSINMTRIKIDEVKQEQSHGR